MKTLTIERDVFYSDTNATGDLSLVSLFGFMQESALRHASAIGIGAEYCADNDSMWVLSRLDARLTSLPRHGDRVGITTWTKGTAGPFALRDYTLDAADGTRLVDATSSWLLLDTANLRPVRFGGLFDTLPRPEGLEALEGNARKLSFPADAAVIASRALSPSYTEIDGHNHVNNTQYVKWCVDMLDRAWFDRGAVRGISINYLRSAELGSGITVERASADGSEWFRGTLDGGETSFIASIDRA